MICVQAGSHCLELGPLWRVLARTRCFFFRLAAGSPLLLHMHSYRGLQERIDALTMEIDKSTLVGSGFRQFEPQRPFAGRQVVQPPTCAVSQLLCALVLAHLLHVA